MLWHFFYSYIIYFIRKHCHSLSIPPHPGVHFYFHLLVSFLLLLNKQLTSSLLLCLCSLACQCASSEFNYPTVVLWCCLVSWWRIHYLITPLDKTVTTLSLPFIPLLTLRLQIFPGSPLQSCLWSPLPSAPDSSSSLRSSCPQCAAIHTNPAVVILTKTQLFWGIFLVKAI